MTGWPAREIPDLSGRTAVVTGGNSGIGYHTAKELADHGARVVVASRSADKGRAAVEAIGAGGERAPRGLDAPGAGREIAAGSTWPPRPAINRAGAVSLPPPGTPDSFQQ